MSVNSELKATKIMGQRKAFYRQRIPEFSFVRKETVDIDILVTSLVPLPFSRGRCTSYFDRLHDFSVTIPRCF